MDDTSISKKLIFSIEEVIQTSMFYNMDATNLLLKNFIHPKYIYLVK